MKTGVNKYIHTFIYTSKTGSDKVLNIISSCKQTPKSLYFEIVFLDALKYLS